MTWTEAIKRGRGRWAMWIVITAVLGRGAMVKGGTSFELWCAVMIGAAVGIALGFGLGPAAEKGATVLSGFLAGIPFYFIGGSFLVSELQDVRKWHRSIPPDALAIIWTFVCFGGILSLAQGFRVRKLVGQRHAKSVN